jgi:hypothetical protein
LPVLIVDDNATNRHILWEWLRAWQMDPAEAGDGAAKKWIRPSNR